MSNEDKTYQHILEEKEERLKKGERLYTGLKVIAVVGIGAGLYGFVKGRRVGYNMGLAHGYIKAGSDLTHAINGYTEQMVEQSKGG